MEALVEIASDVTEMLEVPGYTKLYAVTSDGRVYSYPKGTHKKGKFLKAKRGTHGYLEVRLSKDGAAKTYLVHKLVLL
jgi:hypothetical protein